MNPLFQKPPQHFSPEDLQTFKELEGKILSNVYYCIWKNVAKETESFECLDWLELYFSDGTQITLTAGKESDAIRLVPDFDFRLEKLQITAEFGSQIDLDRIDMSRSPHWMPAVGRTLEWVGLPQDAGGQYLREAVRFDFGSHKVDVTLGMEGLAVVEGDD